MRLVETNSGIIEQRPLERRWPGAIVGGGDRHWAVSLAVFGFGLPVLVGLIVAAGLGAVGYWGLT